MLVRQLVEVLLVEAVVVLAVFWWAIFTDFSLRPLERWSVARHLRKPRARKLSSARGRSRVEDKAIFRFIFVISFFVGA